MSKEESKKVNNKKDRLVAILGSREFTVSHNHMDQVWEADVGNDVGDERSGMHCACGHPLDDDSSEVDEKKSSWVHNVIPLIG